MQNNNFLSVRGEFIPANNALSLAMTDRMTGMRVSKEAINDRCRALLAYGAMENAMTLSAIEAHCNAVAPNGAPRYKSIADAYAAAAASRIARW
jgi:hypothetical protein